MPSYKDWVEKNGIEIDRISIKLSIVLIQIGSKFMLGMIENIRFFVRLWKIMNTAGCQVP